MKVVDKAKEVALKVINFVKKILNTIKFFATPLGTVVGWIIFIIFAVLLLIVVVEVVATAFKQILGISTNYDTFDSDLAVINDLYSSGYSSQIDPENFVNFKAFEYAVLLDASEYIRNQGQTKFDILTNQGLYKKEVEMYEKSSLSDEYAKARGKNSANPAAGLLDVHYNTNQGKIKESDLQAILAEAAAPDTPRHVDPVEKYDYLSVSGEVKGGNNRVSEPYLVYEFVRSTQTANESGELTASAVPYIYIIREDIKYKFYFDANKKAIEVPFLLNAYIYDVGTDSERVKEAMRITAGLPVKVWPDKDMDPENGDYTWTPFYNDDSKSTIYKIPLQTLIGRYMPRTELLHAWTMLKQNIDQNVGTEDEKLKLINGITDKIKQIYSEACLDGESVTTHKQTVTEKELDVKTSDVIEVEKTYEYDQGTTNKTSFVEFKKVGLETTMYKEYESDAHNVTYVSGFGTATILVDNKVTIRSSDLPNGQRTVNMESVGKSVGAFKQAEYIIAQGGNNVDGYAPPNNLNVREVGLLCIGKDLDKEALKDQLFEAACESLGVTPDEASGDMELRTSPVFYISEKQAVGTMEVEHRRMPALLVTAATTWARKINYTHSITQNMFEPTNPGYIIPNCTKSLGIVSFITTESNKGKTYRGAAYEEIFYNLQEKDVLSMLITLESAADKGTNDCYEYMRELYKLVKASQDYSQKSEKKAENKINPNTYTYVYLPNSILYYNDTQTQAIYWQELLGQRESMDAITKEEVERVRTRDSVLKWQIVDYNNYPECEGKVYALNPFGSAYVRAAHQLAWESFSGEDNVNGAWNGVSHKGADLYGRNWITEILEKKGIFEGSFENVTSAVREYSLEQLKNIYNSSDAEEYLKKQLEEELLNVPIVAVAPGKVTMAGYGGMAGFSVTIDHGGGVSTLYCHLKRWPTVAVGDYVGAGTLLGYEGNTGRSHGVHLHFQINVPSNTPDSINGTVKPVDYIYPTFNPFYYEEKAAEDEYKLSSEYMTLYRTVYMPGENENLLAEGSTIKNTVPSKPLLESTDQLIQKQGTKDLKLEMTGDLGWANKNYNDLYIDEKFFEPEKAKFEIDSELLAKLYGYLPVKTDMIGGLPALTREELDYILKYWLSNRYPNKREYNWLMTNVFTEDTIQKIIEGQNTYKVSAVFALAVGATEQNLGIAYYREQDKILGMPGIYNIFSIKGRQNGGQKYSGSTWNIYDSYGDAFMGFYKLIAEGDAFFKYGRYLIATIGSRYCPTGDPPGGAWTAKTTTIAYDIMKYYTGTDWSTSVVYADNSKFINIAKNFITVLSKLNYGYGEGETEFDPFNNIVTTNNGLIDCSGYVAATVRAYGKFHEIDELIKCNYNSPAEFAILASDITKGKATGVGEYFDMIWKRSTDMYTPLPKESSEILKLDDLKDMLQPGDILIFGFKKGEGGMHVEIFAGNWNNEDKYSVYSCGSPVAGKYDDGDPTWSDHLKSVDPDACSRRTLYGILRLKSNN